MYCGLSLSQYRYYIIISSSSNLDWFITSDLITNPSLSLFLCLATFLSRSIKNWHRFKLGINSHALSLSLLDDFWESVLFRTLKTNISQPVTQSAVFPQNSSYVKLSEEPLFKSASRSHRIALSAVCKLSSFLCKLPLIKLDFQSAPLAEVNTFIIQLYFDY